MHTASSLAFSPINSPPICDSAIDLADYNLENGITWFKKKKKMLCSLFYLKMLCTFFFWLNKTFCYSLISNPQVHLPFYNNQTQIRKPKFLSHRFRNLNIQLLSFSFNAMDFERDLSGSMMHTFGFFCIFI